MQHKNRIDLYREITDTIIEKLEAGGLPPWRQPIVTAGDPSPKNLHTQQTYRGVNFWLLLLRAWERGYERPLWLTFHQAKQRGARVRKAERGTQVIFWKRCEGRSQEERSAEKAGREERQANHVFQVVKHYTVFNVSQIEGLELTPLPGPGEAAFDPIAKAEAVLAGYAGGPETVTGGSRAAYEPKVDRVLMPEPGRFETPESYYATLFHEQVHSTGHSSRLNRGLGEKLAPFGSPDYSKEELVAEVGAVYLCAAAGISQPTLEQTAAYLEGWIGRFRQDKKLIVQAAGQAQRAADLILGVTFDGAAGGGREAKPRVAEETPKPGR